VIRPAAGAARRARAARLVVLALALGPGPARADKGHLWPSPVQLSEASQRGIILHDGEEEVLILGVELEAARAAEILEFIPFPAEPTVGLAEGDPFAAVGRLVRAKRLEVEGAVHKDGAGGRAAAPVELTFAARMGVHDVAVVRVNDAAGFEAWVRRWFVERGAGATLELGPALEVAQDYLRRGYRYFVFDRVEVGTARRFAAPLVYRFRSARLYYPLRTSNIVGGEGVVQLVTILPGSFALEEAPDAAQRFWRALRAASEGRGAWRTSTSAKLRPEEAEAVYPGAARLFARTPKLYLQSLEYAGPYRFGDDLLLDLADLRPFAAKLRPFAPPGDLDHGFDLPGFTEEEIADYCEAIPAAPACQVRRAVRP
jgi:hypothetical protein